MPPSKFAPLTLCLMLAACAGHASPEDAQMAAALCAQGKTLLSSGKTGEARDIYASAAQRDPDNARAWNGLGVADDLLGKRGEAEDAYKRAIDLTPGDPTAANNLAHLYLAEGDAEGAADLLAPYADDPTATPTLKQNLAAAQAALQAKQSAEENYADLGSYPTEGMAQAHLEEAKKLMGEDAEDVVFALVPEVKVMGGTPVFSVHATGGPPQKICDELNSDGFPCFTQGK